MHGHETHTLIVGASAAGLAVGCCLKRAGIPFVLLEQHERIAAAWRNHYDRLRLHTSKGFSELPYFPFPAHIPRYPTRDQFIAYLESYAAAFDLRPRFGQQVISLRPANGGWETTTRDVRYDSENVVIATGYTRSPYVPTWRGLEDFEGEVMHSARYRSGARFRGSQVLVVGFGNSAGEIALDLWEHGASVSLAVRGPVNVVPRDLLGVPIVAWAAVLSKIPPRVADRISAPLLRIALGDLRGYGLSRPPYGPLAQICKHGGIPLLDVGTIRRIKEGKITVRPGIDHFTATEVVFADQRRERFDVVISATGYRPGLDEFLQPSGTVTDRAGVPLVSGAESALAGLYFCGFHLSAAGMLREIAREAKRISRDIQAG